MNNIFDEMKSHAMEIINSPTSDFVIGKTGRSCVVCVMRGKSGKLYRGVNIGWWHSACAEIGALSEAFVSGEEEIEYVMAVKKHKQTKEVSVISSCGICREMFAEIMPNIKFVLWENQAFTTKTLSDLLPY